LDPLAGELGRKPIHVVKTNADVIGADPSEYKAKTISPDELIGWTYLRDPEEDGQRFRAKVVRNMIEMEDTN
jgi:hypothetical protein